MTLSFLQTLASTDEGRERIRVIVAELRGWRFENYGPAEYPKLYWKLYTPSGELVDDRHTSKSFIALLLPSYTTSRDACAEFEAGLTEGEKARYAANLYLAVDDFDQDVTIHPEDYVDNGIPSKWAYVFPLVSASALPRCIAFILTKTKGADRE